LQPCAVKRRIRAIDADKRGEALYRRIFQNDIRHRALALGHAGERHRLRCLQCALDDAVVLHREKAFRDENPQKHRQRQGAKRDAERQPRVIQHALQKLAVAGDHPVDHTF